MRIGKIIPTEAQEQMKFAQWLRIKNIPHTHVANERKANVNYKKKLARMGVSAGFPDVVVFLPNKQVYIELKRSKKSLSRISPAQKAWIETINKFDYATAQVCYGADEAIKFIEAIRSNNERTD